MSGVGQGAGAESTLLLILAGIQPPDLPRAAPAVKGVRQEGPWIFPDMLECVTSSSVLQCDLLAPLG